MRKRIMLMVAALLTLVLTACPNNPPPDFDLSLEPKSLTLNQGSSGSISVNLKRQGDFAEAVTMTVSGLPTGITADALTIEESRNSGTLTLRASSETTMGDSNVNVIGASDKLSRSVTLRLTVIEKPAPGSLDNTFDEDGKVITDVDNNYDQAYALALQRDGKIIAAGISRVETNTTTFDNEDFSVVRYNPDGSLDTSFDNDGKQTTDFGGREQANAVAIQPDGKIVVAGWTWTTKTEADFALVRYTSSGSLDARFGSDGKVTTDFGGNDSAWCMVLQPDGKTVVAGSKGASPILARYNANGSLDTSFGGTGKVTFTAALGWVRAMTLQSDGKMVLAGLIYNPEGDFGIVRYNPDGSLDTSFDTDGWLTTDLGGKNDEAYAVTLQSDGKIIAAGHQYTINSPTDFALARYNSDGSLDANFDTDGKLTSDFGDYDEAQDVVIQPDGKIVAAGMTGPYPGDFALARYNPDGSLDTSFDTDGKLTTDTTGGNDLANAILLQPDGKIVVAGFGNGDFGVARYWP